MSKGSLFSFSREEHVAMERMLAVESSVNPLQFCHLLTVGLRACFLYIPKHTGKRMELISESTSEP